VWGNIKVRPSSQTDSFLSVQLGADESPLARIHEYKGIFSKVQPLRLPYIQLPMIHVGDHFFHSGTVKLLSFPCKNGVLPKDNSCVNR
jgi:hypothetical protein